MLAFASTVNDKKCTIITPTQAEDIKTQVTENNYIYNTIGQLIENQEEGVKYEYNASGLVTKVYYNAMLKVQFYYNDKGFRTQKRSYADDGVSVAKTTDYILDASGSTLAIYEDEELKELPIYGASRLGIYKKQSNTSVYQLTDHLGNVRVVIAKEDGNDNAVAMVSSTDYYPFGMPMPNRQIVNGEPYRYAYQGQEKDPETGKEAFQLRLWDGRIGRWLTTDPYRQYASPYVGMGNDPANGIDPDGGYKTWFGAALAWIGGGFKGSINGSDNAKTPWHKYSIVTRNDDNIRFDFGLSNGGGKELTNNGYRLNNGVFEFPREGVIREKVNTWREDWKESDNTLASVAYGVIDPPYTFFANFSLISPYPHDLSGKPLTRGSSEHLDASVDGLISLTPLMRVRAAKLNGGQFIKKVNSIPKIGKEIIKRPELRGKLNRAFNWFSSNIGTGIAPNAGTVNSNAKKAHDIIHN